jgi:tetratricopeptide (TPR) repeat protein
VLSQIQAQQPKSVGLRDSLINSIFYYSYCLSKASNPTQAKQEFDRASRMTVDRPGPCNNYSWLIALDDRPTEQELTFALSLSEQAIKLAPQSNNYWNTRALVLARAAKWSESLEAIDKAMELTNGGSTSDWYIKAMALAGLGQIEEAQRWFSNAESIRITQSPNHTELRRQSILASELLHQESQ